MFCPYAVNRKTVTQTVYDYNEDGSVAQAQTVETNNAEFLQCKQQECGAFRNGKCCYNEGGSP